MNTTSTEKKMKIAFINYVAEDVIRNLYENFYPEFLHIAAVLKNNGFDPYFYTVDDDSVEKTIEAISLENPGVMAFPFQRETINTLCPFIRKLKNQNKKSRIVVMGKYVSFFGAMVLEKEPCIDSILYGESETTFLRICEMLRDNEDPWDCPGTFYCHDSHIYRFKPGTVIQNLDEIYFPQTTGLLKVTTHNNSNGIHYFSVSPARVNKLKYEYAIDDWNNNCYQLSSWRGRSLTKVIQEIECLAKKMAGGNTAVHFSDVYFEDPDAQTKERAKIFVNLLEEKKMRFLFSFHTRALSWNKDHDSDLIKKFRECGLFQVILDLDNIYWLILNSENKRSDIFASFLQTKSLFNDCEVSATGRFIMFHPYVTIEGLRENAAFLDRMELAYPTDNWSREVLIMPSTPLFQQITHDGLFMGFDKENLKYLYAFENGKVYLLYTLMTQLQTLDSVNAFIVRTEKIRYKQMIYKIIFSRNHMEEQLKQINKYEVLTLEILNDIGKKQKNLFLQLLDRVENNQEKASLPDILSTWNKELGTCNKTLDTLAGQYHHIFSNE